MIIMTDRECDLIGELALRHLMICDLEDRIFDGIDQWGRYDE